MTRPLRSSSTSIPNGCRSSVVTSPASLSWPRGGDTAFAIVRFPDAKQSTDEVDGAADVRAVVGVCAVGELEPQAASTTTKALTPFTPRIGDILANARR